MTERPLCAGADKALPKKNGHAGLWYDKFCDKWANLSNPAGIKIDKGEWISQVTGCCGNCGELTSQSERRRKMIESMNGRCVNLQTVGPFVTGLGRDHPVENGFLWHHTLGVPYLPGSSVKGMVKAWAKQWREEEFAWQGILGTERQVGEVVFFDALPGKPVELVRDVMTPHYGEYYRDGKPPGDWIDPTPIPFLAIGKGATFCFAVAPRQRSAAGESHCETACRWLEEALEWIGAGAKTAVGYGRFEEARPAPPRALVKDDAVEATLYRDDRNRWCGRTEDGQSGTIFGSAPDDAVTDETRTLYVRVPPQNLRNLEFQWALPGPAPSTGRRPPRRSNFR